MLMCFDALWCVWVTKLDNRKEMLPLLVLPTGNQHGGNGVPGLEQRERERERERERRDQWWTMIGGTACQCTMLTSLITKGEIIVAACCMKQW